MNMKNNPHDDMDKDPLRDDAAAYVLGEMAPAEAEAFERRLESDAALRRETEAMRRTLGDARDWLEAPPPGADRAEGLPIPALRGAAVELERKRDRPAPNTVGGSAGAVTPASGGVWARRLLAAAAVFVFGFVSGRMPLWKGKEDTTRNGRGGNEMVSAPDATPGPVGMTTVHIPGTASGTAPSDVGATEPSAQPMAPDVGPTFRRPPASPSPSPKRAMAFAAPPVERAYEENGKIVIETRAQASGGRLVWVVDAGLRIVDSGNTR